MMTPGSVYESRKGTGIGRDAQMVQEGTSCTMMIESIVVLAGALAGLGAEGGVPAPFAIEVVDAETGRGVPLVELETVNNQRFVTDSNGLAALDGPDLMGQDVFVHVKGHGYEFPKDGFGYRGKALKVEPGGEARLVVKRINIAERLYRVTGGGIYRDTAMLGREAPIRKPLLNALVFGSDSVIADVYRGRIHWFWGDTNKPSYPLGTFDVPGARSSIPSEGGLDPGRGVDLDYYVDEKTGFARPAAKMPGAGPTWIGGMTVLRDSSGGERMFAGYVKVRPPMEAYEHGLAEWDDEARRFEKVATFAEKRPIYPNGHTFRRTDPDGTEYVYFTTPFPLTRARADPATLADVRRYEGFSPLKSGTRLEARQLDRGPDGRLVYAWKVDTPPLSQQDQDKFLKAGAMKPEEALIALRDAGTGRTVLGHGGSVYWNDFRKRWIMIAVEIFGESSVLGEVWYAEADAPTGPWVYARKVVTHDKYSFYNPKQHPFFDQDGGRTVFFEGTYTHTFSGNTNPTPRYDYNQVMYRLDLSDPRLNLPVAVYVASEASPPTRFAVRTPGADPGNRPVAFFAPERPGEGTVPVFEAAGNGTGLRVGEPPKEQADASSGAVFHALPADLPKPPSTSVPLYEFAEEAGGKRAYSTDGKPPGPGFVRAEKPFCLVWRTPRAQEARPTDVPVSSQK